MSSLSFMDKLLDGSEVKWKTLGEIGKVRMCKRILKAQTSSEGEIPFYKIGTFGKKPNAYIPRSLFEEYKAKYSYPKIGEILISASGTIGRTVIFDGEDAFFQDSNIVWIENDESVVLNKFLFYFYKIANWGVSDGGTIQRLYNDNLQKLLIPIPCPENPKKSLEIQAEIVRILDTFTELTTRKKQYNYYRDKLLTFEDGIGIKQMALGEIYDFQYGTGNTIPTTGGQYPVYGSNGIVGSHDLYNSEDAPVIGHIGAYAGIVNWGAGKHFVTYNGVICRHKSKEVLSQYAYYLLLLQDFGSKSNSASQPFVSYHILKAPIVMVPPLAEQERIVTILDKFDTLTNSITEGLPREIELRQKQYEYYRDLLLSFPKQAESLAMGV